MLNVKRKNFARNLCSLYDNFDAINFDVQSYNLDIMKSFVELSYGTEDEAERAEMIEFGSFIGNFPEKMLYGFKVKNKDIFVGSVLNYMEQIPIPEAVSERYPDLTHDEWIACIRMITLVMEAFSPSKPIVDKT